MDAATDLYGRLNTVRDVLALKGKEEDLFLEVKRATVPMTQDDKANLSKALSGFANSSGGLLIFGLVAHKANADEPDVISKEEPIKDLDRFIPDVQTLIGKAVVPVVEGVEVKTIRYEKDPTLGFVTILVPESGRGPHRAMLKGTCSQYYKRSGDSFYVMEHFDLADMFGKRRRPDLRFGWRFGHFVTMGSGNRHFSIILGLENIGRGIARYPLFGIRSLSGAVLSELGVDGNRNQGLPKLRSDRSSEITFAGGINDVIHPGTTKGITALGDFDSNSMPNIKFESLIGAEDLEARTQEVEIGSQILMELIDDSIRRDDWVFI